MNDMLILIIQKLDILAKTLSKIRWREAHKLIILFYRLEKDILNTQISYEVSLFILLFKFLKGYLASNYLYILIKDTSIYDNSIIKDVKRMGNH